MSLIETDFMVRYVLTFLTRYVYTNQIITNYNNNLLNLFYLDGRVRVIRGSSCKRVDSRAVNVHDLLNFFRCIIP